MMTYPAALPNVVAVSGVGQNLAFAEGICGGAASSNYGGHVDIAAPFEAYSTIGVGAYGIMCGTSMAAPHVTGAVALIQAKNPAWSADRVVKQLLASARPAGAAGWDPYYGYGILDVEKAVGPELADPRPAGPTVTMTGPAFTYTGQTYTWSASASGGTGSYSYLWHRRMAGSNVWVVATTDPSLSLTMFNDQDFELRVTVASGGKTVEATRSVTVQSLCDGCQEP
jgi:subtilisin family serine protease